MDARMADEGMNDEREVQLSKPLVVHSLVV
jgi:hypothetical protein